MDHIREKLGYPKYEAEPEPEKTYKDKSYKKQDENKGQDGDNIELHVSNISLKATEGDIRTLFEEYGEISRVKLIKRGPM